MEKLSLNKIYDGREIEKFETSIKRYVRRRYAFSTSSGTMALYLALHALRIKKGDQVMLPDYTFPAVANVVAMVGAEPCFVDIDLETFNISIKDLKKKWSRKVKAIIAVDQFGLAADFRSLIKIANDMNVFLIEDAASALGGEYHGRKCGALGDVSIFSFGQGKIISSGEGGMVLTDDVEIAERIKGLRNHGLCRYEGKVDFFIPGLNLRMAPVIARIGRLQLKQLKGEVRRRNRIASLYNRLLFPYVQIPKVPRGCKHAFQSYVVTSQSRFKIKKLQQLLARAAIPMAFPAYALHRLYYYKKKYRLNDFSLAMSTYAASSSFALPVGLGVDKKLVFKIKRIFDKLNKRR